MTDIVALEARLRELGGATLFEYQGAKGRDAKVENPLADRGDYDRRILLVTLDRALDALKAAEARAKAAEDRELAAFNHDEGRVNEALARAAAAEADAARWQQRALALYWCRLMESQGGPDGSDHDEAVEQDAEAASGAISVYLDEQYPDPFPDLDARRR